MFRIITVIFMALATGAAAEMPKVVTDIPAVHSLVSQVMQGAGTPEILLGKGADAHSFQMRPSQARALAQADLVFWVGPELTPWLDRAIEGIGTGGKSIPLLNTGETNDPHAWLDPQNAIVWLDLIASEFAAHDPENAALYQSNATAAKARITDLLREVKTMLKPAQNTPIIVSHDAYSHFANRFHLTIIGAIRHSDATSPGAAHLAELRALVSTHSNICAFGEVGDDPALMQVVTEGHNIPMGWLDPMGTTLEYGPDLYNNLIRNMAREIASCQGE